VLAGDRDSKAIARPRESKHFVTIHARLIILNCCIPKHTDRVLSSNQQLFSYILEKYSCSIFPKIYNTRDVTNNAKQ